jgi:phage terminase large subunit-like protein
MAVLADPSLDPETYVIHYGAGTVEMVDWTDPKNWAKWNPNYPHSPKHDFLVAGCVARRSAIRVWKTSSSNSIAACGREQAMRWFPMHLWARIRAIPRMASCGKNLRPS